VDQHPGFAALTMKCTGMVLISRDTKMRAFACREFEHIGIASAFEIGLDCGEEVKCRFPVQDSGHDGLVQVGIRDKPDAHGSGLLIAWRARSNLAQSPGFASASGMEDSSMAFSLASR